MSTLKQGLFLTFYFSDFLDVIFSNFANYFFIPSFFLILL